MGQTVTWGWQWKGDFGEPVSSPSHSHSIHSHHLSAVRRLEHFLPVHSSFPAAGLPDRIQKSSRVERRGRGIPAGGRGVWAGPSIPWVEPGVFPPKKVVRKG